MIPLSLPLPGMAAYKCGTFIYLFASAQYHIQILPTPNETNTCLTNLALPHLHREARAGAARQASRTRRGAAPHKPISRCQGSSRSCRAPTPQHLSFTLGLLDRARPPSEWEGNTRRGRASWVSSSSLSASGPAPTEQVKQQMGETPPPPPAFVRKKSTKSGAGSAATLTTPHFWPSLAHEEEEEEGGEEQKAPARLSTYLPACEAASRRRLSRREEPICICRPGSGHAFPLPASGGGTSWGG